jgi:hypothetical protein
MRNNARHPTTRGESAPAASQVPKACLPIGDLNEAAFLQIQRWGRPLITHLPERERYIVAIEIFQVRRDKQGRVVSRRLDLVLGVGPEHDIDGTFRGQGRCGDQDCENQF